MLHQQAEGHLCDCNSHLEAFLNFQISLSRGEHQNVGTSDPHLTPWCPALDLEWPKVNFVGPEHQEKLQRRDEPSSARLACNNVGNQQVRD